MQNSTCTTGQCPLVSHFDANMLLYLLLGIAVIILVYLLIKQYNKNKNDK